MHCGIISSWHAGADSEDSASREASQEPESSDKASQASPDNSKASPRSVRDDDSGTKEDYWDEEDELEEYIMKRDLGQIKEQGGDSSSNDEGVTYSSQSHAMPDERAGIGNHLVFMNWHNAMRNVFSNRALAMTVFIWRGLMLAGVSASKEAEGSDAESEEGPLDEKELNAETQRVLRGTCPSCKPKPNIKAFNVHYILTSRHSLQTQQRMTG